MAVTSTVEPAYNGIGLCDTSLIVSDILWCQLRSQCQPKHYTPRLKKHSFITTQHVQSLSGRYE